jgi:GNAT superfamily N-acetyltransferase
VLVRLETEDERSATFDCGDNDLNEFFFRDSRLANSELVAVTYAWIDNGNTLAYFSVSNDAVKRELLTGSAFKRVTRRMDRGKRYSTLPAVKIGRLAVDKTAQASGLGTDILDFIKYWFTNGNKTGCRFVVVDAYNNPGTVSFYQKNSFQFLLESDKTNKTRLMFFDLKAV